MECKKMSLKLCGITTVGPKGQIVIPKEVREKMGIETGAQFAVVIKDEKYIGLVKNEDVQSLMEYVKNEQQ